MRKIILRRNEKNSNIVYVSISDSSYIDNITIENIRELKNYEKQLFVFDNANDRKDFINIIEQIIYESNNELTLGESIDFTCYINDTPFIYKSYLDLLSIE